MTKIEMIAGLLELRLKYLNDRLRAEAIASALGLEPEPREKWVEVLDEALKRLTENSAAA